MGNPKVRMTDLTTTLVISGKDRTSKIAVQNCEDAGNLKSTDEIQHYK